MPETARDVPRTTAKRWLLAAKAQSPDIASGYYRRTDLLDLIEPLQPLTVLRAPSGFGKTSVLADVFCRWRDGGRVGAWLTIDEDDTPGIVDAYLAFAFKLGGLPLLEMEDAWLDDAESELPHRARRRTELLAAAIKAHAAPCLLVLDDVERLVHSEAADTINFLLQSGPPNLHVALAMRDNPGLDLAKADLAGQGVYIGADELRFSAQQIEGFFDCALSLRELAALERRTEGWPVALRIVRNLQATAGGPMSITTEQLTADRVSAEWFGERLLSDLPQRDRKLLLEIALFDWITPTLAREVLREDNIGQRIDQLIALQGLLQQDGDHTLRLNPLLREYCAARHRQEDLAHFQMLHRRIAAAEAHEGRVVQALRHAGEASDAAQIGQLLEDAGGVRLWARVGVKGLIAVNDFLTPAVIDAFPRAALVRCTVLVLQSRFGEAFAQYEALRAKTRDFEEDRSGGDDDALRTDNVLVQATLAGFNCLPLHSAVVRVALASIEGLVARSDLDPVVEGAMHLSLSLAHQQRARFDAADRCGGIAKAAFHRAAAAYGSVFINLAMGTSAMAQGRVKEAADHYGHGAPTAIADILSWELEHERSCNPPGSVVQNVPSLPEVGWVDVYAAAHGTAAELAFDPQAAIFSVDQALDHAHAKGLATVSRFLSALRITWLAKDGLVEQAERSWQDDGLPKDDAEILDTDRQSWREMEALACGRVRLLLAQGELPAVRELVQRLCRVADQLGLRRVLMNGIVLSATVEWRSGEMQNAVADLADFLHIAEETGYYRPLAREREAVLDILPSLLGDDRMTDVHAAASTLADALHEQTQAPVLTARELAILRAIGQGSSEAAIAASLGISEHNLQFHLDDIQRKTGAANRSELDQAAFEAAAALPRGGRRNWRSSRRASRF